MNNDWCIQVKQYNNSTKVTKTYSSFCVRLIIYQKKNWIIKNWNWLHCLMALCIPCDLIISSLYGHDMIWDCSSVSFLVRRPVWVWNATQYKYIRTYSGLSIVPKRPVKDPNDSLWFSSKVPFFMLDVLKFFVLDWGTFSRMCPFSSLSIYFVDFPGNCPRTAATVCLQSTLARRRDHWFTALMLIFINIQHSTWQRTNTVRILDFKFLILHVYVHSLSSFENCLVRIMDMGQWLWNSKIMMVLLLNEVRYQTLGGTRAFDFCAKLPTLSQVFKGNNLTNKQSNNNNQTK